MHIKCSAAAEIFGWNWVFTSQLSVLYEELLYLNISELHGMEIYVLVSCHSLLDSTQYKWTSIFGLLRSVYNHRTKNVWYNCRMTAESLIQYNVRAVSLKGELHTSWVELCYSYSLHWLLDKCSISTLNFAFGLNAPTQSTWSFLCSM